MVAARRTAKPNASKDELLKFYREMLLIRRFEEKAGQLYGMGLIGGFCHLYIGQEAVVVGLESTTKDGDQRVTTYRDHGHMLACGMDPKGVMAELTGRSGGYSRGKGGSMHMFSKEKDFYGGHGIVGANVPIGAGLAFANQYRGNDNVAFTYFGDGAANQGQVYETFNMASLWKLPVIFVIENNQYAMGTSLKRASSTPALYTRGAAFGIPGEAVDGMDVLAVRAAGLKAVEHCREGEGPYILEMNTYRYRGHSMSDPAKYRTREEVQKMREERDPIDHVRDLLVDGQARHRGRPQGDRQGHQGDHQRGGAVRPGQPGAGRGRALDRRLRLRGDETMATQILMPALSPTMEEGTLAKWLVKEGDTVSSGQIIAEIETDKATMEFEAVDEGTVGKILIGEGTEGVKVNTPIAVLLEEGEDASAAEAAGRRRRRPSPSRRRPPRSRCRRSRRPRRRSRRGSRRCPRARSSAARRCARRCATRWPRRCAATATSS